MGMNTQNLRTMKISILCLKPAQLAILLNFVKMGA